MPTTGGTAADPGALSTFKVVIHPDTPPTASVDLFWLPLGAGGTSRLVRWSGRVFEEIDSRHHGHQRRDLYHSALEVHLDGAHFVIEMTPEWSSQAPDRGVVSGGPVGLARLGRSSLFRYEVHRWRGGVIPDVAEAVDSPQRLSSDRDMAQRVLDLVAIFPTRTWGRDELHAGEMWNSNSLTSWLLANSGHETASIFPPPNGRAPGWSAGLVVADREAVRASDVRVRRPGCVGSPRRPSVGTGTVSETATGRPGLTTPDAPERKAGVPPLSKSTPPWRRTSWSGRRSTAQLTPRVSTHQPSECGPG